MEIQSFEEKITALKTEAAELRAGSGDIDNRMARLAAALEGVIGVVGGHQAMLTLMRSENDPDASEEVAGPTDDELPEIAGKKE